MKILLLWPKGFETVQVLPLAFAYLASNCTARGHETAIVDCALHRANASSRWLRRALLAHSPRIIGISFWSQTRDEARDLFRLFPDSLTLAGGIHPTLLPNDTLAWPEVDLVLRGDGERALPDLLDLLAHTPHGLPPGKKLATVPGLCYRRPDGTTILAKPNQLEDLDRLAFPDYRSIDLDGYIRQGYGLHTTVRDNAPVWISRGCPYRCAFCSTPHKDGRKIRRHGLSYLLRLIGTLYREHDIRLINIIDDNFTYDLEFAKQFCRAVIELGLPGLRMSTPNGIRLQHTDAELFALMRRAGWTYVVVAPESGSPKTLDRMRKDVSPELFRSRTGEIKAAGLKVHAFFILGYPGETREDIEATRRLLRDCRFDFFYMNNFQPLPGTPVFEELVASGEIRTSTRPGNYVSGERVYVPRDLCDFDFPAFVLGEYLHQALTHPGSLPSMLTALSPRIVSVKVLHNLVYLLRIEARRFLTKAGLPHRPGNRSLEPGE